VKFLLRSPLGPIIEHRIELWRNPLMLDKGARFVQGSCGGTHLPRSKASTKARANKRGRSGCRGDDALWPGCRDDSMFPDRFTSDYCRCVGGVLCQPM
jgi:hypothetical protein